MKLSRTVKFHPALFYLLPLVNVLFLVCMMFGMSSRFMLQPGVLVTLPFTSFTLGPQKNAQIVSIAPAPEATIYFRNREVTLDQLAILLSKEKSDDRSLILKADRTAPYGLVTQVMNEATKRGYAVVLAGTPEPVE